MGARAMVSKVDGSICDSDFGIETAFSFSSTAPNKSPEVEDAIGGTSTVDFRMRCDQNDNQSTPVNGHGPLVGGGSATPAGVTGNSRYQLSVIVVVEHPRRRQWEPSRDSARLVNC
jgi:hypothetical protein